MDQWPRCQGRLSGSTLARCRDQEPRLPSGSSVCPAPFQEQKRGRHPGSREDNDLEASSILRVRWIKLPYRRVASQTCSHAIFVTSKPEIANKILTNGLIICQKNIYAKKCKKEPTRCLKCHGWGHLSYDCTQQFDTCGTCTGRHCTADCQNRAHPRCVSCRAEGHPSWDRHCPTFVCKCDEMSDRLTENYMPYFPMSELWTQVAHPPKPSRPAVCPMFEPYGPPWEPQRMGHCQMTLHFPHVQQHGPHRLPTNAAAGLGPAGWGKNGPVRATLRRGHSYTEIL